MTYSNERDLLFISYQKPLQVCSHLPESSFRMNSFKYILMLLWSVNQRPKRIILLLPTSFSRPGSAKISENPQKSSDLPHHGLHSKRHVTKCTEQAKESMQKHRCSWDSTVCRVRGPVFYIHFTVLQGR